MNVLIISAWDPTSGVLTVYRSLARHLRARGVTYSAFAFDGWGVDTWWTFCDELIDGRTTTLAAVLRSRRYDVLHCLDGVYAPPYAVEKWVRRARYRGPTVLMAQNTERHLNTRVHATRYVACSRDAADVLAQAADGPVAVISNGYDEEIFRPAAVLRQPKPVLLWVGRSFDPQKGVDLFFEALESLPDYDAILVDTDPEASQISDRLAIIGSRLKHQALLSPQAMADVYRTVAASGGALVSTSRWEGFPLAAAEAMACGCPVVAPRVPGHAHLVDGANALVYDRNAGAQGIVNALKRLADSRWREGLIERARGQAEREWTSRAMAEAYLSMYQEALAACPNQRLSMNDRLARTAWRFALAARPAWQRARRLITR